MGVFSRKSSKKEDGDEDKNGDKKKKRGFLGRSKRNSVGNNKQKDEQQSISNAPSKKPPSWLIKNLEQLEKNENTIESAKICWRLTRAMECSDQRNDENEGNIVLQVLGLTSFVAGLVLPLVGVPMMGVPDVLGLNPTATQAYDTIDQANSVASAAETTASIATSLLMRGKSCTREDVVESGGIPVLVTVLRRHINNSVATAAILRTLWEVNRFTIPWDLIRLKMLLNGGDQSAAVASYYSQVWVKSIKKNFDTLTSNGGHLLILEAIKLHMGKEKAGKSSLTEYKGNGIPDLACCILGTLLEGGCNIQQDLLQAGAASIITDAIENDEENVWLVSGGLIILRTLLSSSQNHDTFCSDMNTPKTKYIASALQALTLSRQDPKGDGRLAFCLSKLAEDACIFLSDLAYEDEINTERIGRMGGIEKILDTLRHFEKNMAIQKFGFLALIILSWNTVNQEEIGKHKGIVVALDSLKNLTNAGDDGMNGPSGQDGKDFYWGFMEYNSACFSNVLPVNVCDALYMFIRGSKTNADQLIHQNDWVDIFLKTVAYFSESSEVQNMILKILVDLLEHKSLFYGGGSNSTNFNADLVKKVLKVIFCSLRNNPDVASIQRTGCTCLKMIAEDYRRAGIVSGEGGITVVLDAMLRHPDDLELQELGCLVMESLSNNPNTHAAILVKKSEIREIAGALLSQSDDVSRGGGRLLMALCPMIESQNALSIAKELSLTPKYIASFLDGLLKQPVCTLHTGCKVIKILASDNKNGKLVTEKGGVVIVANAMLYHPENIEVQVQGCAALANLAVTGNKIGTIRRLNGLIGVVLRALRDYPQEAGLQTEGCKLLRNIVPNPTSKESIIKEGGIPVIMNAISNHPNNEQIQTMGCSALSALAANQNSHPAIKELDVGIGAVLNSIKNYPHLACMQIAGCRFIRNMAVDFQSIELLCREGGVDVIINAMSRYLDHVEVQVQCCAAISNMAGKNEGARETIVAQNGCSLIISAMKRFRMEPAIQEQGCRALDGLGDIAHSEYTRIVEVVRDAKQHNPNSAIIQRSGIRIMHRLDEGSNVKGKVVAK